MLNFFFLFIENPVVIQPEGAKGINGSRASMGQAYDSYVASNAIDGDLSTYTAAKFLPPHKVYFYLWIYFGKTYLFVYIKCKLLSGQGFNLHIGRDEQLPGTKWVGYMSSSNCNNEPRSFKTVYKMVKGRYARLLHTKAFAEFKLAEIEFYGF